MNRSNKAFQKIKKIVPPFFFYMVTILLLLTGIVSIILLIIVTIQDFMSSKTINVTCIVGIATTLLSAGILTNSLATFMLKNIKDEKALKRTQQQNVTNLIEKFNESLFSDFSTVLKITNNTLKNHEEMILHFKPCLTDQNEKVVSFEKTLTRDDYLKELIDATARIMVLRNEHGGNNDFRDFLLKIIAKKDDININSAGCKEIIRYFRQKRVRIYNFFEKLSIEYFNDISDRDLIVAQFKDTIVDFVQATYYDMYCIEGNSCYPSLMMLCEEFEKMKLNLEEEKEND